MNLQSLKVNFVALMNKSRYLILKDDKFTLVVWNPFLGKQGLSSKDFLTDTTTRNMYSYALGYENKKNKSRRSHKILRFIDLSYEDHQGCGVLWYEIYDFGTGSWTTFDVTPNWRIQYSSSGVSLNGNTYWFAKYRNLLGGIVSYIICFDFTSERFGPLLPLPFAASIHELLRLTCVREEKLAALIQSYNTYELDIWIMTKIETEMILWSKFVTVNTGPIIHIPIRFVYESFFIDEEEKVAVVFSKDRDTCRYTANIIREDGYFRKLDLGECTERQCWPLVCSYVPSLETIKPRSRKRKRQSNLEKRRCEENIQSIVALEKAYQRAT